jgi:hypothetical protein
VKNILHDPLVFWLVCAGTGGVEVILFLVATVQGIGRSAVFAGTSYSGVRKVDGTWATIILEFAYLDICKQICCQSKDHLFKNHGK